MIKLVVERQGSANTNVAIYAMKTAASIQKGIVINGDSVVSKRPWSLRVDLITTVVVGLARSLVPLSLVRTPPSSLQRRAS